jgi:hypothetical protein
VGLLNSSSHGASLTSFVGPKAQRKAPTGKGNKGPCRPPGSITTRGYLHCSFGTGRVQLGGGGCLGTAATVSSGRSSAARGVVQGEALPKELVLRALLNGTSWKWHISSQMLASLWTTTLSMRFIFTSIAEYVFDPPIPLPLPLHRGRRRRK